MANVSAIVFLYGASYLMKTKLGYKPQNLSVCEIDQIQISLFKGISPAIVPGIKRYVLRSTCMILCFAPWLILAQSRLAALHMTSSVPLYISCREPLKTPLPLPLRSTSSSTFTSTLSTLSTLTVWTYEPGL